jgi:hypothetical protein
MSKRNSDVEDEDDDDAGSVNSGFEALMNRTYEDIPDEVMLPGGTYRLKVRNASVVPPREAGQSGKLILFFIPKAALSDVDPADLPDDITAAEVGKTVWLERPRDWKAAYDLLAKLGVEIEGKNLAEAAKAARGKEVNAAVTIRSFQSNGVTKHSNEAKDFSPIDDE